MSKSFKIFSLILVILLISISISGCKKEELKKVRLIEVTHSLFYTPQYVAITEGFF